MGAGRASGEMQTGSWQFPSERSAAIRLDAKSARVEMLWNRWPGLWLSDQMRDT